MKTRNGFVSNSSSTSFCILGVGASGIEGLDTGEVDLDELLEGSGLEWHSGVENYYGDDIIGISPDNFDENLTIKQSKEKIADLLNKKFGTEFTCRDVEFFTDGGQRT